MRTYKELIEYATCCLPKEEVDHFERVETIFDLSYATLEDVDTFPLLSEAILVSSSKNLRDYYYSVFYFKNVPFAIYTMGGRSERDHENVYVVNKSVWLEAKRYVLSLVKVKDDCNNEIDINSDIRPEYNSEYPWEYLPEENHPDFYIAKAQVNFLENSNLAGQDPIQLAGYGYTELSAKNDLQKMMNCWTVDNDVEFGEIVVEKDI